MTPDEIGRIAGSLSMAQREGLPALQAPFEFITWEGLEYRPEISVKIGVTQDFGLCDLFCLTPLGLAVRDHLKANPDG